MTARLTLGWVLDGCCTHRQEGHPVPCYARHHERHNCHRSGAPWSALDPVDPPCAAATFGALQQHEELLNGAGARLAQWVAWNTTALSQGREASRRRLALLQRRHHVCAFTHDASSSPLPRPTLRLRCHSASPSLVTPCGCTAGPDPAATTTSRVAAAAAPSSLGIAALTRLVVLPDPRSALHPLPLTTVHAWSWLAHAVHRPPAVDAQQRQLLRRARLPVTQAQYFPALAEVLLTATTTSSLLRAPAASMLPARRPGGRFV
ncbi:hypothetical protein B0H14DRAFT_3524151 [Mycena olivaceomarginata]|nr:hypothetical protein B0H14DRAFT_3524151 [Mycena olivaceomarginata]